MWLALVPTATGSRAALAGESSDGGPTPSSACESGGEHKKQIFGGEGGEICVTCVPPCRIPSGAESRWLASATIAASLVLPFLFVLVLVRLAGSPSGTKARKPILAGGIALGVAVAAAGASLWGVYRQFCVGDHELAIGIVKAFLFFAAAAFGIGGAHAIAETLRPGTGRGDQ